MIKSDCREMWSRWRPSCDWEPGHRWAGARGERWSVSEWCGPARLLTPSLCHKAPGIEWAEHGCHWPTFSRPNVHLREGGTFLLSASWIHISSGDLMHYGGWYEMIPSHYFPADDNISSSWASFNSVPVPGAGEVSRRHTHSTWAPRPARGRHTESE